MHLFDPRVLGGLIVVLLLTLVAVKRVATGTVFDVPSGGLLERSVNVFNLAFLLVVNPAAAVLLLTDRLLSLDATHVAVSPPGLLLFLEIAGLCIYVAGFVLMGWALVALGRSYQLGGSAPRAGDRLVTAGPYRLLRHPMYAAALAIAFGLASLVQSLAFAGVFVVYVALVLPLIAREEAAMRAAYGEAYEQYRQATARLVPFLY